MKPSQRASFRMFRIRSTRPERHLACRARRRSLTVECWVSELMRRAKAGVAIAEFVTPSSGELFSRARQHAQWSRDAGPRTKPRRIELAVRTVWDRPPDPTG